MAERIYLFALTKLQARVAREALASACAGDWAEGDFCWTQREYESAEEAGVRLAHPCCVVLQENADLMRMKTEPTRS